MFLGASVAATFCSWSRNSLPDISATRFRSSAMRCITSLTSRRCLFPGSRAVGRCVLRRKSTPTASIAREFWPRFTNSLLLAGVAVVIVFEAIERLRNPVAVHTGLMLGVALLALLVNGGITLALVSGRRDLNVRSILLHSFGDALSNVAIIAGALVMRWTGVYWVDPAIGIAIGAMVFWSGWGILRESSHILLEGLPRQMRLEDVAHTILGVAARPGSSRHSHLDDRDGV